MNNVTYFVAPKGEGKTKWLRTQVEIAQQHNNAIYMYAPFSEYYHTFCEEFFRSTGHIAHVNYTNTSVNIPHNSIVIIDDLTSIDCNVNVINALAQRASHVYITIEGNSANKCKGNCKNEN